STAQLRLDQSAKERLAQGRLAWHEFKTARFAGVGPGHAFQWRDNAGLVREGFNIDTPLAFVAKFGLLGIGTLFFVAVQIFAFIRSLRGSSAAAKIAKSALVGYVSFAAAWSLLGAPFEDKGFSFGLLFLVLIALRSHAAQASSPSGGQLETP